MSNRNWIGGVLLAVGMAIAAATSYLGPEKTVIAGPRGGAGGNNSENGITCYFSPDGGCTDAVVEQLERAQSTILLQAYSFTSTPIAKALVAAHERGVQITAILDKSQRTEQYSAADFVLHAGIPTYIDDKHAIAHNKIMLIDGKTIITGSFNFTKGAEHSNAENMLVINDKPVLFEAYQVNFRRHLEHAVVYAGREAWQAENPEGAAKKRKR